VGVDARAQAGMCMTCGIDYFSAPYDLEAVDMLDPFVDLFKIGSGDITWPEMLRKVASKQKAGFAGDWSFGYWRSAARRSGNSADQFAASADAMQYQLHRESGKLSAHSPASAR
jgi:hypothetical protein